VNFLRYERELKVPYYLVFYPEKQELTLFHLKGRRYHALPPNEHGRLALATSTAVAPIQRAMSAG
jgi:hypothetical protein